MICYSVPSLGWYCHASSDSWFWQKLICNHFWPVNTCLIFHWISGFTVSLLHRQQDGRASWGAHCHHIFLRVLFHMLYLFLVLKSFRLLFPLLHDFNKLLIHKRFVKVNIQSSLKYSKPNVSHSLCKRKMLSHCNVKQLFELRFILLVCLCQVLGVGFRVHSSCMSICQSSHK